MVQIWQALPTVAQQIVIAVIAGAILYILAFSIRRFVTRSQEQEKKRDEKLRIHFEDLKKELPEIIPQFAEICGKIMIIYEPWHKGLEGFSARFQNIGADTLTQPTESFIAHFPKERTQWDKYRLEINTHNKRYEDFCLRIKNAFESQGIDVRPNDRIYPSPYIYDTIFHPLFKWWQERRQGKANPLPNFKQIETDIPSHGPSNLFAAGWGAEAIAYAETDTDKKSCQHVIDEVAQTVGYESKAANILGSADKLIKEITAFKRQLTAKLDDVNRFWPGTKEYKFKKVKDCPKCRQIFG